MTAELTFEKSYFIFSLLHIEALRRVHTCSLSLSLSRARVCSLSLSVHLSLSLSRSRALSLYLSMSQRALNTANKQRIETLRRAFIRK